MNQFVLVIPAVVVVLAVAYGAFRALGRVWVEYKLKIALIEKIEARPELIPSFRELQSLVNSVSAARPGPKQDFVVTGVILGVIGLASVIWAGKLNMGRISSGIYFGGVVCVCLGFILSLLGVLIRNTSGQSGPSSKEE